MHPFGISLATRYLPSEQRLNVGGDWYDVERRSESELCIAIGDLVGRAADGATSNLIGEAHYLVVTPDQRTIYIADSVNAKVLRLEHD